MEYFNGKMVCATFVYNKEKRKRITIKKTAKGKKNLFLFTCHSLHIINDHRNKIDDKEILQVKIHKFFYHYSAHG